MKNLITKTIVGISFLILMAITFTMNSNQINQDGSVILENIAALNQANAEDPYGICCGLVSMETCYTIIHGNGYREEVIGYFLGFGC